MNWSNDPNYIIEVVNTNSQYNALFFTKFQFFRKSVVIIRGLAIAYEETTVEKLEGFFKTYESSEQSFNYKEKLLTYNDFLSFIFTIFKADWLIYNLHMLNSKIKVEFLNADQWYSIWSNPVILKIDNTDIHQYAYNGGEKISKFTYKRNTTNKLLLVKEDKNIIINGDVQFSKILSNVPYKFKNLGISVDISQYGDVIMITPIASMNSIAHIFCERISNLLHSIEVDNNIVNNTSVFLKNDINVSKIIDIMSFLVLDYTTKSTKNKLSIGNEVKDFKNEKYIIRRIDERNFSNINLLYLENKEKQLKTIKLSKDVKPTKVKKENKVVEQTTKPQSIEGETQNIPIIEGTADTTEWLNF